MKVIWSQCAVRHLANLRAGFQPARRRLAIAAQLVKLSAWPCGPPKGDENRAG